MDGLVAVLAVTMAGQVARPKTDSRDLLPTVPTAVDVIRGGDWDAAWVRYDVRESYPAVETIRYLVDAMSQRNWKLVQVAAFRTVDTFEASRWIGASDLNQGPVPRGYVWSGGPTGKGHLWEAWWRDRSGRGVALKLEYRCPMEQQGLHSVWAQVSASMYGPDEAARQEAVRKRMHDGLCPSTGDRALPADPSCGK